MALARQAVSGRWQAFWQVRAVGALVRSSWLSNLVLAVAFALLNLPVMALKTWPQFLPEARTAGIRPKGPRSHPGVRAGPGPVDWNQLTDVEALSILNFHYLGAGFLVFAAFLLRRMAARLYAQAVLRGSARRAEREDLGRERWRLLHTPRLASSRPRPVVTSSCARSPGRDAGRRFTCVVALVEVWFAFVGTIYISEFLAYHPVVGWMNQPLVQLPWFRYIPHHLEDPMGEPVFTGALVAIGWMAGRLAGGRRRGVNHRSEMPGGT
jgi:hypothetical protein